MPHFEIGRERQKEQKALADDRWTEHGLVFTKDVGTPLDVSNVLHRFQKICAKAGLPKIRYDDLRHTHASLPIAEGKHRKQIAERLGHSSIKLTMDTYGHLFPGSDRESAEAMDKLFGAPSEKQKQGIDKPQGKPETKVVQMRKRRAS